MRNWHFDQNGLVSDETAKSGTLSYLQQRLFHLLRIDLTKSRVESPFTDAYLVAWSLEGKRTFISLFSGLVLFDCGLRAVVETVVLLI